MTATIKGEPTIPEMTAEELARRHDRTRPLIVHNGELWEAKVDDISRIAYTWNATPVVKRDGLVPFCCIRTDHECAYYGFFKPSAGEVLSQIPDELLDRTVAYQIDTGSVEIYSSGAGHRAVTTLYERG